MALLSTVLFAATLSCDISLPANQNFTLSAPINEGMAEISYGYTNNTDPNNVRSYIIEANVWNIGTPTHPELVKGYLKFKQDGKRNYAINHCYADSCFLEVTAVLDGIGMRAECLVK